MRQALDLVHNTKYLDEIYPIKKTFCFSVTNKNCEKCTNAHFFTILISFKSCNKVCNSEFESLKQFFFWKLYFVIYLAKSCSGLSTDLNESHL